MRENRAKLAERVREFWVGTFMSSKEESVARNPILGTFRPAAILLPGTRSLLADEFCAQFEKNNRLVISGPGGSGKTFAMVLHLVRKRLTQSVLDGTSERVPVVFDASTFLGECEFDHYAAGSERLGRLLNWPEKSQLFYRWARRQLEVRYKLKRAEAQELIDNNAIEYFIDGLSELGNDAVEAQAALSLGRRRRLLEALEEVLENCPVCLCVRDATGEVPDAGGTIPGLTEFSKRGDFQTLRLQPVPDEVVAAALSVPGYEELHAAAVSRIDLWAVLTNLFFLDCFLVAFKGRVHQESLQEKDIPELRKLALKLTFEARWQQEGEFPRADARRYLGSLARIAGEKATLFLTELAQPFWIEHSQPEPLPPASAETNRIFRAYENWTCGTIAVFVFLVILFAVGLGQWWEWASTGKDHPARAAVALRLGLSPEIVSFTVGWATGFLSALSAALVVFFGFRRARTPTQFGLAFAIAAALSRGLMLGMSVPVRGSDAFTRGLLGVLGTFVACLIPVWTVFNWRDYTIDKIFPLADARWSWREATRMFVITFGVTAPVFWLLNKQSFFGLAPAFAVIAAFVFGYAGPFTNTRSLVPNHGIHQSRTTALIFLMGATLLLAPLVGYGYYLGTLYEHGLLSSSHLLPSFGPGLAGSLGKDLKDAHQNFITNALLALSFPVCTIIFGGFPVVQHYVLRWMLDRAGRLPFQLPRFCEKAAKTGILRQVGTGFQFDHEEMRKYLAK